MYFLGNPKLSSNATVFPPNKQLLKVLRRIQRLVYLVFVAIFCLYTSSLRVFATVVIENKLKKLFSLHSIVIYCVECNFF